MLTSFAEGFHFDGSCLHSSSGFNTLRRFVCRHMVARRRFAHLIFVGLRTELVVETDPRLAIGRNEMVEMVGVCGHLVNNMVFCDFWLPD